MERPQVGWFFSAAASMPAAEARGLGPRIPMDDSPSIHVPVLLAEVVEWLAPRSGQTLVDGTLGGGGHTAALAERVGRDGVIIALDRDPAARLRAERRLAGQSVKLVDADFRELATVLAQLEIDAVDGVVLDLGLSSDQLADDTRGFSFDSTGVLDLRFDPTAASPQRRSWHGWAKRSWPI